MSYTQYDQYGGNPYNNGPDAEAAQGGPVSFPSTANEGWKLDEEETNSRFFCLGIFKSGSRPRPRRSPTRVDQYIELLQRWPSRDAGVYSLRSLAAGLPRARRQRQSRDPQPHIQHLGNHNAAPARAVVARQQLVFPAREPRRADPAEEHADPGPDQVPGRRFAEDAGWI